MKRHTLPEELRPLSFSRFVVAAATMTAALQPSVARADWNVLEEAKEIVNISTVMSDPSLPLATYKSAEDPNNPVHEISDEDWPGYTPPAGYLKNTTRNLQFNESEFLGSPGTPGQTSYIQTGDGYTWAAMSSAINAMWPYNSADYDGQAAINAYYAGNLVTTPDPGVVKVTANYKAQNMKFWAREGGEASGALLDRYLVTDQWGNTYIMHASGQLDQSQVGAAFDAAVLPEGWTKQVIQLEEDLILNPATSSTGLYHYLVFRDSADNTYHQIGWGAEGINLATQVAGMPIWGGTTNDLLLIRDGHDSLIYGGGGIDTVRLDGLFSDWFVTTFANDGAFVELFRDGRMVSLYDIAFLQFDDLTLAVTTIPEPATALLPALVAALALLRRRARVTSSQQT